LKVLSVNKYHQLTGGGDRFFFDTNEILAQHGHDVVPFCLDYTNNRPSPYQDYFPSGVSGTAADKVGILQKAKLFANGVYSLESKSSLSRLIRDIPIDVAHLHVLHYTMSPSVIDALHSARVPIVFSLHDYRIVCVGGYLYANGRECHECMHRRYYTALKHRCYRESRVQSLMGVLGNYLYDAIGLYDKVDVFTVPHEGMRALLGEFGISKDRILILKNPLLLKGSLPSRFTGNYVLYFGQISRQKGVFTLLEAACRLPNIRFVFCGSGPALDELRSSIETNGANNVEVDTTTRWGGGLEQLIAGSRFVVSPSEWPTPLEYSTLETMALGKAIVASRIGGNREIIEDGSCGLTFIPGDSADLTRALLELYDDPARLERMGNQAKANIARDFSPEKYFSNVMDIYGEAVTRRANR
jgi:glycosyltransferase involved in cell wall biosynthesis